MTADDIRILLDYNYWARDRALASAERLPPEQLSRNLGSSFGSVLDTLVHIYFAEWIWHRRWQGESPSVRPDTSLFVSVATLREAWLPLEQQIRSFVDALGPADLSRMLEYKSMNGQPSTSPYWQMIVHVVNHGSYHRGQLATMMRQLAATPAESTDMIVFFRENPASAR
jgi:uncharacterized damage-inducible protein DinB